MQYSYPDSLANLIQQLTHLPGIGPKSAQRLAFHILHTKEDDAMNLAKAIVFARKNVHPCRICGNLTDDEICSLCKDANRDESLICVVEQPRDVISMERSHSYNGLYHVLHGALSPMEGIGPQQLNFQSLLGRLEKGKVKEVVMATNPNVEGETTALYLARRIKPLGIKVTRIAHGIPVGGDLEYADEATLAQALYGRKEIG
ncbi:MAG: recombination mediator RecR [Clostridiales bacterium]